jgi:DNA polymerase III epsilon subunit-like protein
VALKINKYSPERWKLASPLTEALAILSARTKGAIMVGHNVSLDWDFLERAFRATGVECFMDFRRLDTIAIAFGRLYDDPYARKFSLQALCDRFGIVNANPHTALSDARATYELYKQMLNA